MPGPVYGIRFVHQAVHNGVKELDQEVSKLSDSFLAETAKRLLAEFKFLGRLIDLHSASEDEVLFPAIEEKEKDSTLTFFKDHKTETLKFQSVCEKLEESIKKGDASADELLDLKETVSQYADFICAHMEREESELWPRVDKYYSPPEQGVLMGKIGAFFNPEDMIQILPWVLATLDETSRKGYVQMIKIAFPAPVFEKAKEWIHNGVSGDVWQSIESAMGT